MPWIIRIGARDWEAVEHLARSGYGPSEAIETDRMPAPDEMWDWDVGGWVPDSGLIRAAIDAEHRGTHGDAAIVTAHIRKAIEASIVLAGGRGRLLEAEAAARGVPVEDLARLVIAQDDAAVAAEVARVMRKADLGRSAGDGE